MAEHKRRRNRTFYTAGSNGAEDAEPARGRLLIAGCRSGNYLAAAVVERYRELLREAGGGGELIHLENIDWRFSDGETNVRLEGHVGGYDVFVFQGLLDPTSELTIDQNYMSLLIAARAFREHGASHVTAVVPYLAYARQDKPTKFMREPTSARLMADLSIEAGIDRLIAWDPHSGQIRGFYGKVPTNMLAALTLFLDEFEEFEGRDDVIAVAPDAGAAKFVTHFGRAINVRSAIGSKYRPSPEEVEVTEIIGDFGGKKIAVVLDDMISTGGTVHAVTRLLVEEKGIEEVYLGASHNLCLDIAHDRLAELHGSYGLKRAIVTNSIPQTQAFRELPFLHIHCLSGTLARAINRIHHNRSVSEVFYRPQG